MTVYGNYNVITFRSCNQIFTGCHTRSIRSHIWNLKIFNMIVWIDWTIVSSSHLPAYSYLSLYSLIFDQTRYSFYCCMETKTYIAKMQLQKLRVLPQKVFQSIVLRSPSFDWHSQLGSLWERRLYNR